MERGGWWTGVIVRLSNCGSHCVSTGLWHRVTPSL